MMNLVNLVEPQGCSSGVYEVLKALPDDTMERIFNHWSSWKKGYFGELWDDVSWNVAVELLWHPEKGIVNHELADKVIQNSMVESIEAQGGINAAFIPHPIPKELGKLFTAADYQVVFSLGYCLEQVMTQSTFNNWVNRTWITQLLNGDMSGKDQTFDSIVNQIESDTLVEDFIENVVGIANQKKKANIEITLQAPSKMRVNDLLKELNKLNGVQVTAFVIK